MTSITIAASFKAGDPPPKGYLQWHAWADAQAKAGLKQRRCAHCSLWRFPQELSAEVAASLLYDSAGNPVPADSPVCLECVRAQGDSV